MWMYLTTLSGRHYRFKNYGIKTRYVKEYGETRFQIYVDDSTLSKLRSMFKSSVYSGFLFEDKTVTILDVEHWLDYSTGTCWF